VNEFLAGEALRAAGIAGIFLAIFAAAEGWRIVGSPQPEWTRKLVHFGGGLVSLALPWVVRSHWTVLALGATLGGLLLLTRRLGMLTSVHGVTRHSEGAIYFPVAVYLVFLLAADRPILYLISVLTLVVSDALAALVGSTYGRIKYRVERDRRSFEGSAVFFLATFLAVHLPLLLLTSVDRNVSVLVAIQIALLVTILEAISLDGADNLIVPIGTFLLLLKMTPQAAETLLWQLLAQLTILSLLFLLAWRLRLLTAAGTLAASIFLYGAWSLGGPAWLVAPVIALVVFGGILRLAAGFNQGPSARYQVLAVFYTTLAPAGVLILNDVLKTAFEHPAWRSAEPLYPLFLGILAGQLALLCLVFWTGTPWVRSARPTQLLGSIAIAAGAMIPTGYLVHQTFGLQPAVAAAILPALAAALYLAANHLSALPRQRPWDGRLQAACVGASALLLAPFFLLVGG
jgi:dolichol kinase